MLIPAILLLGMITVYPFVISVGLSFFDYSFLKREINFVGLKNYIDILSEGKYLSSIRFTFLWTIWNVLLIGIMGFITSLLLRQRFFGRQVIKATMLIPWILPQVVTGFTFNLMMAQEIGILTRFLFLLGLVPADFSWFIDPKLAAAAVVVANSWRGFPFVALMLFAKMQSIPSSLMEAAQIDGANSIQVFRHIIINYIKPVVATCLALTFIWSFNAFDIIKVMTGGGPLEGTSTLALRLQREAFDFMQISRACTMAVCTFVLLLAIAGAGIVLRKLFLGRKNT